MTHIAMKRTLCTLAAAALVAGSASAGTIILADEFGAPVVGATVVVTPMYPEAATAGEPVGLNETARELKTGGYFVSATGPMMIEVTAAAFGKVTGKAAVANGETVELVLGMGQDGAQLRRAGQADVAGTERHRGNGGSEDAGGDTCALATVIPWASITAAGGYTDAGNTGTVGNMPSSCGITGSDVFYQFTTPAVLPPGTTLCLTTCLANSPADTVLEFRQGVAAACAPTVPANCNDDSCAPIPPGGNPNGFNSTLTNLPLAANTNYSISVDNWASVAPGSYTLNARICPQVTCPPGATLEGELNCGIPSDSVNGGCNYTPNLFSPLTCGQTYCGTAGNTGALRDTYWYQVVVPCGIEIQKWCCTAEYPQLLGLVNNGGGSGLCPAGAFQAFATSNAFTEACVTQLIFPGTWWWFQATSGFGGTACGADYNCTLTCQGATCGGTGGGGGSSN